MTTETRNPLTLHIDQVPIAEAVSLVVREDSCAIEAVLCHASEIAEAVALAVDRVKHGGSIHYFGAGSSGRIAMLDASELRPTFGVPASLVQSHFPGGNEAVLDSAIDLEDSVSLGVHDASGLSKNALAIGITASGHTPYVAGALREARRRGTSTVLITCSDSSSIEADLTIALDTGPEAVTGSTRLKAGTATKSALTAFSTALMIQLGKTHSNLMTSALVTNDKLRERAVYLVRESTGASALEARRLLEAAGWQTDVALVSLLAGCEPSAAETLLRTHGSIRAAANTSEDIS